MIPYLDDFLRNYRSRYGRQVSFRLDEFCIFLNQQQSSKDNILDATYQEVLEFFKEVDKKDLMLDSKEKYRNALNQYFKYAAELHLKMNYKYLINPVPTSHFFRFSDIKDRQNMTFEKDFLEYNDILKTLKFFYYQNFRMYIFFSLISYSGARPSEICSILIEDLDLENRKFISGRFENYSKKGIVLYFWPKFLTSDLEKYVKTINSKFLFPSSQSATGFLHPKTPRRHMSRASKLLKLDFSIQPKMFRDAINSARQINHVDLESRQYLLNHKPDSVNSTNYLKRFKDWKFLQELYDKTFPYPIFRL